jgi:hypothetical protein
MWVQVLPGAKERNCIIIGSIPDLQLGETGSNPVSSNSSLESSEGKNRLKINKDI